MSSLETAEKSRPQQAADHRRRMLVALALAALAAAAAPSAATASDFSPEQPALDQYAESLPVAEGDQAPDSHSRSVPLARGISRQLSRSATGQVLEHLATSPASGAPTAPAAAPVEGSGNRSGRRGQDSSAALKRSAKAPAGGSLASAAVDSAGGSGGAGLVVLLLMGAVTAAALGARWRAGRSR